MTAGGAVAFVERHGAVLQAARGKLPCLAEAVAGGPIRGSWWSHPRAREIFRTLDAVARSPDVVATRLAGGKVTLIHRRLWPAIFRLARDLDAKDLASLREVHTPSGRHRVIETPFPEWVPAPVRRAGRSLSREEARALLGPLLEASRAPR